MAYGADGVWKDEQDSVETRVRGLASEDNALNKQVRTQAAQAANQRGLQNSSIAVGAGEDAVLKNATTIATADARIGAEKNLSAQGHAQTMKQQGAQIASTEKMHAADVTSRHALLEKELGSREKMAEADRIAEKERLGLTLTSQEKVAKQEIDAANARLDKQMATQVQISQAEIGSKADMAQRDREMQLTIANMNVAANNKEAAMQAATAITGQYSQMFATIAANHELSAGARANYLNHLKNVMLTNIAMVETTWGIDLPEWQIPQVG